MTGFDVFIAAFCAVVTAEIVMRFVDSAVRKKFFKDN